MARFPADFDETGNARIAPFELNGDVGGTRLNPLLIVTFIVLLSFGAIVAWLAWSARTDPASKASVSISMRQAPGEAEDLIHPSGPAQPAAPEPPPMPSVRRVLPATLGADGRIILAPAPDADLIEQGENGPLPKIAADGAQSWHVYAHPFPAADSRPKIALVIGGMGLSKAGTERAIQRLPAAVSLAITPDGEDLQNLSAMARAAGHETFLELPMEPYDYPDNDPGPHALLTSLLAEENKARLEWLLGRFTGYAGVINFLGGKFVTSEAALAPVMMQLKGRGLMIIDEQPAKQSRVADLARRIVLPFTTINARIDEVPDAAEIDAKLAGLEQMALAQGHAAGIGLSYPVTIERVVKWAGQLEAKGFVLAPVSALAQINGQ